VVAAPRELTARDFVELFGEGWRKPDGAAGILEFFGPYLDPAVRMTGPLSPDIHGLAQVEEYFRLLFDVIPDLHGHVAAFDVVDDEVVRLSMALSGTIGRHTVELKLRDRLVVRGGKLVVREAKGVPLAMTGAIIRTPRVWRKAARLLIRLRWSAPPVWPEGTLALR
jgi:hypothetical protein